MLGLVLALGLLPTTVQASAIAVTRVDGTTSGNVLASDYTNGWEFSPTADIVVDSLGIFDAGGDGLAQHHDVKLWDIGGAELANVSLSAGIHLLTSGYAFADITEVRLTAGETYVVSTFVTGGEGETFLADGTLVSAPEIEVTGDVRRWTSGDAFPASTSSVLPVPLGPNFTFETVAAPKTASTIPEPLTGSLLLAGLIGFGFRARRSRINRSPGTGYGVCRKSSEKLRVALRSRASSL